MVDGEGDPNTSKTFEEAIEALYSLSYTLKFSLKKSPKPIDYGVMPLEGLWWADTPGAFHLQRKSAWKWTAMILQPDFIGRKQVDAAFEEVRRKKKPDALGSGVPGDARRKARPRRFSMWGHLRTRDRRSSGFTTSSTQPAKNSAASITRST